MNDTLDALLAEIIKALLAHANDTNDFRVDRYCRDLANRVELMRKQLGAPSNE